MQGEGGARSAPGEGSLPRRKLSQNFLENAVRIREHVIVPESEKAIAGAFEPVITLRVSRVLSVLPAVDFDDQPMIVTDEIDDVVPDRHLSSKFEPVELT
jgi:hypothetical protein